MLVLTRKMGESIRVGDNIVIKVVELDSRHVKLGIEAPRSVSVNREEIYERIQQENKAASSSPDEAMRNIADAFRRKKNT